MWAALTALVDQKGLAKRVKFNNEQAAFIEKEMSKISGMASFQLERTMFYLTLGQPVKSTDVLAYAQKRNNSSR